MTMISTLYLVLTAAIGTALSSSTHAQQQAGTPEAAGPVARFEFNGDLKSVKTALKTASAYGGETYVRGLDELALRIGHGGRTTGIAVGTEDLHLDASSSFSVQFWVRTAALRNSRMALLSQKEFHDMSHATQKGAGWAFFMSGGTWAWNMGSGKRRIAYERDNGEHMPINDGRWHQLTMTYDSDLAQVWLYYDGVNKAIYNVQDSTGFDFTNARPLIAGSRVAATGDHGSILPAIHDGARSLQDLVDAFSALGLDALKPGEFVELIVEPKQLFERKVAARVAALGNEGAAFAEEALSMDFESVSRAESQLMRNPYTVHQAFSFMEAAPLLKIYTLVGGKVTIDKHSAQAMSAREQLHDPDFDLDNLTVWDRPLQPGEILDSYTAHFDPVAARPEDRLDAITTGVWNIFHGGLHFTVDQHGWDSRLAIAQIIERESLDVVMLQETYSAGDFIAAELGYYFATTVDWDYLNQGSNISVISRYPIREVRVPEGAAFMNVAARVAISETQDVWVMSNWYGMNKFEAVADFHAGRFNAAESTPVFFGGDFNAIPHTDGGTSPASTAMQKAGFTDAFRSLYPDVAESPGFTHRSGRRIDQLYFKGPGLRHTSTSVIKDWPIGFPSDHFLIRSTFELR